MAKDFARFGTADLARASGMPVKPIFYSAIY
jgi:hypothetical protein